MNADNAEQRMKRILRGFMTAQEDDADCSECYDHLDQFVEMVDAGKDATAILPRIEKHLSVCTDCDEEYEALLTVLRAEIGPNNQR